MRYMSRSDTSLRPSAVTHPQAFSCRRQPKRLSQPHLNSLYLDLSLCQ
ncbi:MAG: hypothetical protein F6K40_06810 [Okeania sp. SIO3I5]|nr:hypothetical protein [Okeania sp. SIO3I5]NEQ36012.1 hypothetical protein [Okeania sp. SIO3I5]